MDFKVKLPIIVHVDNLGTIFMSENVSVSQRTKHVDIRYRSVQEFVLDGFIKIIFVRTNKIQIFSLRISEGICMIVIRRRWLLKKEKFEMTSHSTWKGVTRC